MRIIQTSAGKVKGYLVSAVTSTTPMRANRTMIMTVSVLLMAQCTMRRIGCLFTASRIIRSDCCGAWRQKILAPFSEERYLETI